MNFEHFEIVLVTVTYNAERDVEEFFGCYDQLSTQGIHLVVIDNASSDGTAGLIKEFQKGRCDITVIANPANRGVAAANNQGIKLALEKKASWIVLINNDVSFGSDLIENLTRVPGEKVSTPVIPYYGDPETIWFSTGKFSVLKGFTGTHIDKDRSVEVLNNGIEQYSEYAPTCCMAIRSEVFSVVGLMDEAYFVYFDDTDFCWRLREAGYRIRFVDDARLLHKVGSSTGGVDSPFTIKFTSRNRIFFLKKHKGVIYAVAFFPIFLGYYCYKYLIKSWCPDLFRLSFHQMCYGFCMSEKSAEVE